MRVSDQNRVVIIGGGPAGLTAAYELSKAGVESVVLEQDHVVGGIARTVNHRGYLFDIGGHRFFTKVKAVNAMWREVLGDDFLHRARLSRIYYGRKFFYYPLKPLNALVNLGLVNAVRILASYAVVQVWPSKREDTFEQWVSNRFGKRLYEVFFKTYTEKVWGIACTELSAEWAAQRIQGLSLIAALKAAFSRPGGKGGGETIKTLIDAFDYPRRGPGQMWETVAAIVSARGSDIRMGAEAVEIHWTPEGVTGVVAAVNGAREMQRGSHFISSMPIRDLVQRMVPQPPLEVVKAANALNYRDFLTVALVINKADLFPDNWIYVHDAGVKMGRIQNFKNWSPDMVPDQSKTCLGLEYFCFEGDSLWTMSDAELIALGTRELEKLGLARAADVEDGAVVRMPKAYPVYDSTYVEALGTVRAFLSTLENMQLVGRNGMHRYNNQDHSMLTAMLAVKNVLGGSFDLWGVNADQEYHETIRGDEKDLSDLELVATTQPRVARRVENIVA